LKNDRIHPSVRLSLLLLTHVKRLRDNFNTNMKRKRTFLTAGVPVFWIKIKAEYPESSESNIQTMMSVNTARDQ